MVRFYPLYSLYLPVSVLTLINFNDDTRYVYESCVCYWGRTRLSIVYRCGSMFMPSLYVVHLQVIRRIFICGNNCNVLND